MEPRKNNAASLYSSEDKNAQRPTTRRGDYERLRVQLENERSSFISHWKELGEYILPRRPRFFTTDANKGDRRNQKIIDSTATMAARTLRSGMMGGVTSPARPWFRLTTPDPDLAEVGSIKDWLHIVTRRMSTIFLKSNLYNCLPTLYGDMGVFGVGAIYIEEDMDDVIRCYPFPVGSFMVSNNHKLKVDVFFREFRMTVRQLLAQFGERKPSGDYDWSNFSDVVKSQYDSGNLEAWVDVCHVIRPNPNYDEKKLLSKYKRYVSCYYEKGSISAGNIPEYTMSLTDREKDKVLSEKGYDYFPVLCPRWETTGEDVYGTSCPGMESLGDVKALQLLHKRKAQAIEKMVNPPLVGPSSLRSTTVSILPGNITYQDMREGQSGLKPIHEVTPRIQEHVMDIQEHQNRIRRVFYEDLFLMMAQSDRREITAREIDERHEEKLLALGPVLEQLNQDLLDPLIDIAFDVMLKRGMIPEAPEELQGADLRVEYISVMAQAQKLVGISSIERFAGFVGNIVTQTADPTTLDKVDIDQMIDEYGDALSMPPRVIRPDDEVEEIRAGRAQAVQAQRQQEAMANTAKTTKDLAGSDMGGDNALTRLMQAGKAGNAVPQQ